MRIGDRLKSDNNKNYNKLMKIADKKENVELSEYELKELMGHSSYRRSKGAIKQVR